MGLEQPGITKIIKNFNIKLFYDEYKSGMSPADRKERKSLRDNTTRRQGRKGIFRHSPSVCKTQRSWGYCFTLKQGKAIWDGERFNRRRLRRENEGFYFRRRKEKDGKD